MTTTVAALVALGMLVVVPLGLPLLGTDATHGAANALGLCLCGLLGWRLLRPAPV